MAIRGLACTRACYKPRHEQTETDLSMSHPSSDVAFSPAVKAVQARRGSRAHFAKMEEKGGWDTAITPDVAGFLAEEGGAFLVYVERFPRIHLRQTQGWPAFQARGRCAAEIP